MGHDVVFCFRKQFVLFVAMHKGLLERCGTFE